MDIVLQTLDTFAYDRFYAAILPAPVHRNVSSTTGTLSWPIPKPITPATSYFYFEPSKYAWMSQLERDNPMRQGFSLFATTLIFGVLLYYIFAGASYYFVFDQSTMRHPRFLKNQIKLEMAQALSAIPGMSLLTAVMFWLEVRGYGKFYDTFDEAPFQLYNILQFPLFLLFTDFWIYLIHRGLHHPYIYKHLHKAHHKWIVPTPFASHAFHPVDGFLQSFPYHCFAFVLPLQKMAYVALFVFVNLWTISIHDGEHFSQNTIINGAACHTIHHERFNYNYGQYTTVWDRFWGTYSKPSGEMFDPATKKGLGDKKFLEKSLSEIDRIQMETEGKDEREYSEESLDVKKMQ